MGSYFDVVAAEHYLSKGIAAIVVLCGAALFEEQVRLHSSRALHLIRHDLLQLCGIDCLCLDTQLMLGACLLLMVSQTHLGLVLAEFIKLAGPGCATTSVVK